MALDDVGGPRVSAEIEDPKDNPENRYVKLELGESVSKALGSLSPPLRTTFLLREVEDLSVRETAETLGTSVAAVKSRLKRHGPDYVVDYKGSPSQDRPYDEASL